MKKFSLYCIGGGAAKGRWVFEPFKDGVSVFDPDDREVCWLPHAEANDRFTLPSFWRSIKSIGLRMPDGLTVEFEPDSRSVAKVKEYLEEAIASQGIEAVRRLRKRGWINVLTGLGVILIGLSLLALQKWLGVENRGPAYVAAGLVLGGIGEIAWGFSAVIRARRVRRRLRPS